VPLPARAVVSDSARHAGVRCAPVGLSYLLTWSPRVPQIVCAIDNGDEQMVNEHRRQVTRHAPRSSAALPLQPPIAVASSRSAPHMGTHWVDVRTPNCKRRWLAGSVSDHLGWGV